jgi:hypothetical protein
MAINSLFDKDRKKQIKEDLQKGRLDLSRRRRPGRDDSDDAPTQTFTRADANPVPGEPEDLLPPSMQPAPVVPKNKRAITKQARQPSPFAHTSPQAEGPMGAPSGQSGGNPRGRNPTEESQSNADDALFRAIRAGDTAAAQDAIARGADVNSPQMSSSNPNVGEEETQLFYIQTPLELARNMCNDGMMDLLRRNGANK